MCYHLKTKQILLVASTLIICLSSSQGQEVATGGATSTLPESRQKQAAPITAPANDACMNDSRCRKLVESALESSRARKFEDALLSYQGAYAQRAAPWLLINIGRTQQKLGRVAEAIATYRTFLEVKGLDAGQELRDRVSAYHQQAQRELAVKQAAVTRDVLTRGQPNPAPRPRSQSMVHKKWWFWTAVGAAAVGAAIGAGLGVYAREPDISNLPILQALRK